MTTLKLYKLDFDKTLFHLKDHLKGVNLLADSVLKYTPFQEGFFYTILQDNLTDKELYGFNWGGVGGGVREKAAETLLDDLHAIKGSSCIFDSFDDDYEPDYDDPLFLKTGVHYDKQIYYIISGEDATKSLLEECLRASNVIWHSLCVLSKTSFAKRKEPSITEEEMIEFAKSAEHVLVGAYDAEGYIFWKRSHDK